MHILIAEDEVTIAGALKVMLERNKYAVDVVDNGKDAAGLHPGRRVMTRWCWISDAGDGRLGSLARGKGARHYDARTVSDGESGNRRPRDGAGRGCGRLSAEAL